ncbi:MAG: hydantoinase B/oxoprolinase family protein [Pseudomonadota bacterium]
MTAVDKAETHDPITIDIIQSSLAAITDEMFATMRKTAMSSIIYEVLDFGVGLFDHDGNLTSSGSGIPAFVGMLEPGVKAIIAKFGLDDIHEGDVFMTNMPHFGGVSHLNDVVLIMPVFCEGKLTAWLANKAHWADIGGAFPGSISPDAVDIYQEGLQIPEVRIIDRGKINQALLDTVTTNSRIPDTARGDFWAGVASTRAGERRVKAIAEKYGRDTVVYAIADYIALGEAQARRALKELPAGSYTASETLDDGQVVQATITISEDEFIVDLRGNPSQNASAMNASYDATYVDAQMIFKAVANPQSFANAGSFRPVTLLTDKGSMFDAEYPAAMSVYYEVSMIIFDVLWKALAPVLGDKLPAGHFASICGTFIGGPHPETGEPQSIVEPQLGGWGACNDRDGLNALYTGYHGETFNCPVEVTEQRNGLMVDRLALTDEPGGEGRYNGGKGINLDYRVIEDNWWLTMAYVRSETGPWGLNGGREGTTNYVVIRRADGSEQRHSVCTALTLNKGDVISVHTATGGGYGDPFERPTKLVRDDVKNGYVSAERAREVYGLDA